MLNYPTTMRLEEVRTSDENNKSPSKVLAPTNTLDSNLSCLFGVIASSLLLSIPLL